MPYACLAIAEAVYSHRFRDDTNGSRHYLTTALIKSNAAPSWVVGKTPAIVIGDHSFFNDIK